MVRSIHQEEHVARPPAEVHRLLQLPLMAFLANLLFFFILLSTRPPCPDVPPSPFL